MEEEVGIGPTRAVPRGFRDANARKLTSMDHDWVAYLGTQARKAEFAPQHQWSPHCQTESLKRLFGFFDSHNGVGRTMPLAAPMGPRYPDVTAAPPA